MSHFTLGVVNVGVVNVVQSIPSILCNKTLSFIRFMEFHFPYTRSCEHFQGGLQIPTWEAYSSSLKGYMGVKVLFISSQVLGICRVMWPEARWAKVLVYLMC